MSREDHAREGAQAVIVDDEILDVAVVMPRGSTLAGVLGAAAGVAGHPSRRARPVGPADSRVRRSPSGAPVG